MNCSLDDQDLMWSPILTYILMIQTTFLVGFKKKKKILEITSLDNVCFVETLQ